MTENWFIVQCNPNSERKAAREMRRRGFGVHIPRVGAIRIHHRTGKKIMKRRIAMAGYVFLRFKGPVDWYTLRQCQGVKGVLYVDGHAYQMPQSDVVAIIRAQRAMAYEDRPTRSIRQQMRSTRQGVDKAARSSRLLGMQPGRHISAPMSGAERVIAQIVSITKRGTVKAIIRGKDRDIAVEFTDIDNLEVIDGIDEERSAA